MEESRPLTASSYFNNKVAYFILVLLDLILYIYFEVNMNMPVFFFMYVLISLLRECFPR